MSDLKIVVPGLDYYTEFSTTQVPISLGASGAFAVTNNIATITFTSAHGLTFTPSAGVLPNFFIQFNGATSTTGVGQLNGPVFRILSIPTTTTITIYTSITAATLTSANAVPIFMPYFQAALLSANAQWYWNNATTSQLATTAPLYGSVQVCNLTLGANCVASYNPDNTNIVQDPTTAYPYPPNTIATAPTMRTMLAASSAGQLRFGPQDYIAASGSSGTSRISIVE